jgi:hypothetical protein
MPWTAREGTPAWRWFVIAATVECAWLALLAWLALRG